MQADTLNTWLDAVTARQASRTAITFLRDGRVETEMTYAQLKDDINRMANTLLERGVVKGDRVILFLPKSLVAVVVHFALQALGAMAVPLNPGFKKNEMDYLMGDADARLVIAGLGQAALVRDIDPDVPLITVDDTRPYQEIDFFRSAPASAPQATVTQDDPGLVIYTSGTTGNPKGAVLNQRNLVSDARNIIGIWEITSDDVLCHALPLFHVHGLCFALHTALLSGATVRMLERFDPKSVLAELARSNGDAVCTVFMAVPAMYTKLMDSLGDRRPDFGHMRLFTSGSAPLLVREFQRIADIFGKEPVEREGMSETGMNFSNPLNGRRVPGSIGRPLPGLQVRIVNPDAGMDVEPGAVGELWLRSDAITKGYWRKPKETAETFADGWFRTGDLGRVDENGYYYLTDRIKHIIITGGENVSAKEVETVIDQIEGVDESVVVGKPDAKWGEKVVAAVKCEPGAAVTESAIKAHCREHLHDWKCPKEIVFVESVPRNTMGKVLKQEVKQIFID